MPVRYDECEHRDCLWNHCLNWNNVHGPLAAITLADLKLFQHCYFSPVSVQVFEPEYESPTRTASVCLTPIHAKYRVFSSLRSCGEKKHNVKHGWLIFREIIIVKFYDFPTRSKKSEKKKKINSFRPHLETMTRYPRTIRIIVKFYWLCKETEGL